MATGAGVGAATEGTPLRGDRGGNDDVQRREPSSHAVTAGDQQLWIGDTATHLYAAAVHYWRLDRDRWNAILDAVRGMGFTAVSCYIPWEAHEIERGRFDFGEVTLAPDRRHLYAVNEVPEYDGRSGGAVSVFAVDREAVG